MWQACSEASVDPVRSDPADDTFVSAEPSAFPCESDYLHAPFLHDALDFFLVHMDPLLKKLSMYSPVPVILMFRTNALHLLNQRIVRVFAIKSLLPVHICCLRQINDCEDVL